MQTRNPETSTIKIDSKRNKAGSWGLGFGVQDSGFGVWDLEFGV